MNVILPYSGKFSRGINFHDFHDQTPAHENLFQNVLADESSTVPSSHRSSKLIVRKLTYFVVEALSKLEIFRDLQSTRCNCEYILGVSSLPLAWQFFTDSDRHALISVEILLSFRHWKFTLWVTISMREIVGGAVRHCDLVAKIKIAKFFFWRVHWWFTKIYACENFPLYSITLNRTIEVCIHSHFHIIPISATLQVHWSLSVSGVNPSIQVYVIRSFMRLRLATLTLILQQLLSLSVAKTRVSYILHNL